MALDKEGIQHTKNIFSSEETIKANVSFKKGLIAAGLIVLLILAIGIFLGYAIGERIAADHYGTMLLQCQNSTPSWIKI